MKIFNVVLLLTLSVTAFAEEAPTEVAAQAPTEVSTQVPVNSDTSEISSSSNQADRGSQVSREARKAAREEFKEARKEIQQKMKDAVAKHREAMKAAIALSGDERKAAMAAAQSEFKETLAALRAERKAAREKFRAAIGNGDEAKAMADANKANNILEENDKKNENAGLTALASGEEPKEEVIADPLAAENATDPVKKEEKFQKKRNSTVTAQ